MNKEEFQKNRQILKMLSTDMLNQMHNMYDQLAVAENRIENARKEGYEEGYQARCAETVMCKDRTQMSDLIRRSDVKRDYEEHFSELSKSDVHFSINDIFSNLDNIRSVPALELNEDLTILLKQLGYEKVVRCKDCKNRHNRKQCPYAEFEWLKETEVPGDFYCGNGEKKDG